MFRERRKKPSQAGNEKNSQGCYESGNVDYFTAYMSNFLLQSHLSSYYHPNHCFAMKVVLFEKTLQQIDFAI